MNIPSAQKNSSANRGFTIVEMVVVISIFGILASLVLFRYKNYQAAIDLENTSQDIALEIQKAENYAIAGRYPTLGGGQTAPVADWRPSYGVYFDTGSANQKRFIFFFDSESYQPTAPNYNPVGMNGRGFLSDTAPFSSLCGGGASECLNMVTITNDILIEKICQGTMSDCTQNISGNPLGSNVSLVFTRPFPERIAVTLSSGTPVSVSSDVRIRVRSTITQKARDIVITPLGQIHIETVQ